MTIYTKEYLIDLATSTGETQEIRKIAANMLYTMGQRDLAAQKVEELSRKVELP